MSEREHLEGTERAWLEGDYDDPRNPHGDATDDASEHLQDEQGSATTTAVCWAWASYFDETPDSNYPGHYVAECFSRAGRGQVPR